MLASEGSGVPDLERQLRMILWLLPVAAVLCAACCAAFLGSVRRHRAAGETRSAVAKARSATATALLAAFLAALWGAAAVLTR
ncbi:hypothetical protein ACIPSE_26880 [Streptomyces sp. NPDC090106]|uniref:hypothetical protein n=1 Tax=Streptomyces sp. NPDC090106 TaxID=3365946 RepID=UPI0037F145E5